MTDLVSSVPKTDQPTWLDRPKVVLLVCATAYLPFTLLGFGTDVDVPNLLRSGRSFVEDGSYEVSRWPGAAVHEVATGVLERLGGSVLVNLSSLVFALLCLWCVHELLRAEGATWPTGALLVLATNPYFWIAATSLGDFTWALGLALAGALAAQRRRPLLAGVLFGLGIGCRASTGLIVLAWLLAERSGASEARPPWRATAITLVTAVGLGVLCFIPPWLDADRSFAFLDNRNIFAGFGVHLGRWLVKNVAVIGIPAGVVLLLGVRHVSSGLARWRKSSIVRFGVLTILVSEALYFRFPFKPVHLLPMVVGLALVLGASLTATRRWFAALLVAQLVGGMVGTTLGVPDVEDAARSGRIELGVRAGPLLTDVRCRLDDRERGPWPDPRSGAATQRAAANARCQSTAWRAG